MIASAEEALALLRKWFDEKTLLKVLLVSSNASFTVRMMGFIGALTSQCILISDHSDRTKAPRHYIEINPTACRYYDYLEAKDIEGESENVKQYISKHQGVAGLSIVLSDHTRLTLFEQSDTSSQ